jgi:hypothetical protein
MITINETELVTKLAEQQTFINLFADNVINLDIELFTTNDEGEIIYTEIAQKEFDDQYDYFYTIIMELAETQYSKELPFTTESLLKEIAIINDDYKKKNKL